MINCEYFAKYLRNLTQILRLYTTFEIIIILDKRYTVKSSNSFCDHTDGGVPARCTKFIDPRECETVCTELDSCIAYGTGRGNCIIIPSTASCPKNWNFYDGPVAVNSNELTRGPVSFYNCMVKGMSQDLIK